MQSLVDDGVDRLSEVDELFPSAVTITRTSEEDFGSRQLEVSIDGEWVATTDELSSIRVIVRPRAGVQGRGGGGAARVADPPTRFRRELAQRGPGARASASVLE